MKFTKVYISGELKKVDSTDYVDYYFAENGMCIYIREFLNVSEKLYEVYDSAEHINFIGADMKPFKNGYHRTFNTLKEAKNYIENFNNAF